MPAKFKPCASSDFCRQLSLSVNAFILIGQSVILIDQSIFLIGQSIFLIGQNVNLIIQSVPFIQQGFVFLDQRFFFGSLLGYEILEVPLCAVVILPRLAFHADAFFPGKLIDGFGGFSYGFIFLCEHIDLLPCCCFEQSCPAVKLKGFILFGCQFYMS